MNIGALHAQRVRACFASRPVEQGRAHDQRVRLRRSNRAHRMGWEKTRTDVRNGLIYRWSGVLAPYRRMVALISQQHDKPGTERGSETQMSAHVGDRIVVESERASQPSRAGVIEEVLREQPPRVRVRWEDGHTSILTPSAGVARITPPTTRTKA